MKGLERAKAFYEEYGRDMISRDFAPYEGRIAVGLAGHGSECFGYDDESSHDHDWEEGFCLWIDDETDREIGFELSRAYRALPRSHALSRSSHGRSPTGVRRISDFYMHTIGSPAAPDSWQQWLYLPSHALAEATNGQVWRDDAGIFTAVRETLLHGMPEDVRKKKIAAAAVTMAQAGQYNYARCLGHGEEGAAMLALSEFVRAAGSMVYLLNRAHAPYYKWMLRGMRELPLLSNLAPALEFLLCGENDAPGRQLKAEVTEDICLCVSKELNRQRLSCGSWDYLEPHAHDIMSHIENPQIRALHVMEGL